MSVDCFEVEVFPRIPAKCLMDIESWLLFRVFRTDRKNGYVGFDACWTLNEIHEGLIFSDKELEKALSTSRQVCPELCSAVERQIGKVGWIILGAVDYETIFQAIIRRHPNFLDHISMTKCDRNTGYRYFHRSLTLITATEIGSIYIRDGKIVHRSTPWVPEPCYIISNDEEGLYATSIKNFVAKDELSGPPF